MSFVPGHKLTSHVQLLGKVKSLPFGWMCFTLRHQIPAIPQPQLIPAAGRSRGIARNCGSPRGSHPPVGQQTHPGVHQQLHQSLGGEEQPHAGVLLGQELPTLQAAPGRRWGCPGGVSGGAARGVPSGAAPRPIQRLHGSGEPPNGHGGVVKVGEHGGEGRSPGGCGSRLGQGWAPGAVGTLVLCAVEEGGDDGHWKRAGEGVSEGVACDFR